LIEGQALSVRELTKQIKDNLEGVFPDVWVEGEISNFTSHSSGHFYFSLKDDQAQLQCAMFRFANKKVKFEPGDGLQVLAHGKISVYAKRGDYQLIVDSLEPKGKGSLQLAFEQLKEKLQKEGLFDREKKKPLPFLPEKIGIVTSPTGAAVRDILNVIQRRFSSVHILINPVRVQGKGAAEEISLAIKEFDEIVPVDVIIVARGGGSIEDLWAFNEEVVARSIFNCRTPVISAVGHEIDYTIADFAADVRAPTPSAAAEIVTVEKEKIRAVIDEYRGRIARRAEQEVCSLADKINYFQKGYGFRRVEDRISQLAQQTDEIKSNLASEISDMLIIKKKLLENCAGKLSALDPRAVLRRGYSITVKLPGGDILTSSENAPEGSRVKIILGRGELEAKITKKEV
jgi:exodeoxyribonuclease VII large subunit